MVRVAASQPWVGTTDDTYRADNPRRRVAIDAYCIDRTEVTVRDYRRCVAARRCAPQRTIAPYAEAAPEGLRRALEPACNYGRPGADAHPMNCVDWRNADVYCRWRGARLPTELEWEHAARGDDERRYVWGDAPPGPGAPANLCGPECSAWFAARGMTQRSWRFTDDGFGATAPVGSFAADTSPFGVLDLAGNVAEWTATLQRAPDDPRSRSRVFRGHGWSDPDASSGHALGRGHFEAVYRNSFLGFRCAR